MSEKPEDLRDVTALEAFCLASAVAATVTAGDQEASAHIVALAEAIHEMIINGDASDEG